MRQYDPASSLGSDTGIGRGDPETDEIRVEIEQTRTEMSGTIDAIQQRLAPNVLTEQAKDIARDAADQAKTAAQSVLEQTVRDVKDAALEVTEHAVKEVKDAAREATVDAKDAAWDATVGKAEHVVSSAGETAKGLRSTVIDTIKQNPVPATLAGLSLYWLYRNRPAGQTASASYAQVGGAQAPRAPQAYPIRTGYSRDQSSWSTSGSNPTGSATSTSVPSSPSLGEQLGDGMSGVGESVSRAASSAGQMAGSAGETALDTGSSIMEIVKRNPVPAALVGLGLGWLYMNRLSGGPDYRAHSGDHYLYGSTGQGYQGSSSQGGVGDLARQASDRAGEIAGGVQEQAGDIVGSITDQVGDAASSVQEHASDLAGAVTDRTRRAPGQIQRMLEESPMIAAALAASIGGAVGFALPTTRPEDRLLGTSRDRVMGQAQRVTSDALDKVQDVAQEVQTTVAKETKAQGLTV